MLFWVRRYVSQVLQTKLHQGRLISSEKMKGTDMGYAGKWFILVLVCASSCLSNGYLKMPGLGQGSSMEKEKHLNTSSTASGQSAPPGCGGRAPWVLRAKVPLNLRSDLSEDIGTITLSCSPVGIVDGVSGDSQPIRGVGGRW